MGWPSEIFSEIEEFIIEKLQDGYPFMKIEAVHEAAKAGAELVKDRVIKQGEKVQETTSRCSFLSLASELRNRIYELALVPEHEGDGGVQNCRAIFIDKRWSKGKEWMRQPPLTQVSRQIREETLAIFYGTNHFVLDIVAKRKELNPGHFQYEFQLGGLEGWLQNVGPANMHLLKHLDVAFRGNNILQLSVDEKAFTRDLTGCLEHYGISLPPTTNLLACSRRREPSVYWQPLEFGVDPNTIESRPRGPIDEKSLKNCTLDDRRMSWGN